VFCELQRAEWDFRDVPDAELNAACVWEAARESKALTCDPSRLDRLLFTPAIGWLLALREIFEEDFLSCPWLQTSLEYRFRFHDKIDEVTSRYHCWFPRCAVDEPIRVIYTSGEPSGDRRGREKVTSWHARLRAIGVRRLRKYLTVTQIAQLYQSVGIVGEAIFGNFCGNTLVMDQERLALVERVIKRDAAGANRILMALLPSVFGNIDYIDYEEIEAWLEKESLALSARSAGSLTRAR